MSNKIIGENYRNYRWFYTTNGNLVVGGKNDGQNELVIKNFLKSEYIVLHTSAPGSPFMIIQSSNPNKQDINEAAIFCACFSKQWKNLKNKKDKIEVHIFIGRQIYKTKEMKIGTFGIKGKIKKISVKPELVLVIQKNKIKAVPNVKRKEKIFASIKPGKLSKEEAIEKIIKIINKFSLKISKEEIMQAIPSSNIKIE